MTKRIFLSALSVFLCSGFALAAPKFETSLTTVETTPSGKFWACHNTLTCELKITDMLPSSDPNYSPVTFGGVPGAVISGIDNLASFEIDSGDPSQITVKNESVAQTAKSGTISFTIYLTNCQTFSSSSVAFRTSFQNFPNGNADTGTITFFNNLPVDYPRAIIVTPAFGLDNYNGNNDYLLLNDEVERYYRIQVSRGVLDFFTLDITPQPGVVIEQIDAVSFSSANPTPIITLKHPLFTGPTTSPLTLVFGVRPNALPTDIPIESCSFKGEPSLYSEEDFPNGEVGGDYILIREKVKVTACTDPNQNTFYALKVYCDKVVSPESFCDRWTETLRIQCVERGKLSALKAYISDKDDFPPDPTFKNNDPPHNPPYTGHTDGISLCPDAAGMDLFIFVENSMPPPPPTLLLPYGAGAEMLHYLQIDFNGEYFTFDSIVLGDGPQPLTLPPPANASFPIKFYTIDFAQILGDPDDSHGGLANQVVDTAGKPHLFTGGPFKLLPEGEHIKITLKNFKFSDVNDRFTLCERKFYDFSIGVKAYAVKMCDFNDPPPPNPPPRISANNLFNSATGNRFSGFAKTTSDVTDIAPQHPTKPTSANLTYTFICTSGRAGPAAGHTPFSMAARLSSMNLIPSGEAFDLIRCPDLKYQAVITLPADFIITDNPAHPGTPKTVALIQPNTGDAISPNPAAPNPVSAQLISPFLPGVPSQWLVDYTGYGGQESVYSGGYVTHPSQVTLAFNVTMICRTDPPPQPKFGPAPVAVTFRAVCDECGNGPTVSRTMGCITNELFFHGCGGCDGTRVGTDNFSLNRIIPGWADEIAFASGQSPLPVTDIVAADQVYETDTVKARSTNGLANHLLVTDIIAFEIAYNTPIDPPINNPELANILKLVAGTGKFKFTPTNPVPPHLPPRLPSFEMEVVEAAKFCPANPPTHLRPMLRVYGNVNQSETYDRGAGPENKSVQEWLSLGVYLVDFEADFKVSDDIGLAAGEHQIDQFRGQFIAVDTVNDCPDWTSASCDSWGDKQTFWKTIPKVTFNQIISPASTYGSSSVDQCYLRYVLTTQVDGPEPLLDAFPDEYRPTLKYPDYMKFHIGAGYEFVSLQYAKGDVDLGPWVPNLTPQPHPGMTLDLSDASATSGGAGGDVEISNIHQNYPEFLSIDTVDKNIQGLMLTIRRVCPRGVLMDNPVTITDLNIITRAYSPDSLDHGHLVQITPPTTQVLSYDSTSEVYDITANIPGAIAGNVNPVTVPVTLQHLGPNGVSAAGISLENTWIYFTVDPPPPDTTFVANVTEISIPSSGKNAQGPAYTPTSTGLYHLGTLPNGEGITLNVQIKFECIPEVAGQQELFKPVIVRVHYGNHCTNHLNLMAPTGGPYRTGDERFEVAPCLNKDDRVITITPNPSSLSLNKIKEDTTCGRIVFDIEASSDQADVPIAFFQATPPQAGFTLDTSASTVGGSPNGTGGKPMSTQTGPAPTYALLPSGNTWDVTAILKYFLQNHFAAGSDFLGKPYTSPNYRPLYFHLVYTNCSTSSGDYGFDFYLYGTSSCGLREETPHLASMVSYKAEPRLFCPPGKAIWCDEANQGIVFDAPMAMGNCHPPPVISVVNTVNNQVGNPEDCKHYSYTVTRTWVATDSCGRVSQPCSQTITVKPPPLCISPTPHSFIAGTDDNFVDSEPASPSAGLLTRLTLTGAVSKGFDDCTTDRTVAHTFSGLPPCIAKATLTVKLKACGGTCSGDTIGLSFTAADGTAQPNASWTSYLGTPGNPQAGLLPGDWCDETGGRTFTLDLGALPPGSGLTDLLPFLNQNSFLDFTCENDSAVDYVKLEVISCAAGPIVRPCNSPPTCGDALALVSATDVCGRPVTATCSAMPVEGDCQKSQTFTLTAVDACGASSSCPVTYTWTEDSAKPVFMNCPTAAIVLPCNPTLAMLPTCDTVAALGITAEDLCTGSIPLTAADCLAGAVISTGCQRRQTFTLTATDACGNPATCEVIYEWLEDLDPPLFANCPNAPITLPCNSAPTCNDVLALGITANDACSGPITLTSANCSASRVVSSGGQNNQSFTLTATDACGNLAMCQVAYNWINDCSTNCCITCVPNGEGQYPASYTVTIHPGNNYIANHLCHGADNSVAGILPSVPMGTKLYHFDKLAQTFDPANSFSGVWSDPAMILDPGEGFVLHNPGQAYVVTFQGCEPTNCPPPCAPTNGYSLVGRLGTGSPTYYSNLFTCPPVCGTELVLFDPITQDFTVFNYVNSWKPWEPILAVGQSAFARVNPNNPDCCVSAPDGLALWLPLDEPSGSTSSNLAIGGLDGEHVIGSTVNDGYVLRSLCFDGTSQYVYVPTYPAINVEKGDLSIDAWVKRGQDDDGVRQIVNHIGWDPQARGYALTLNNGVLNFFMRDAAGQTATGVGQLVPADGNWHFVAVTVARGTPSGTFYLDNTPPITFTPLAATFSLANGSPLLIGAASVGPVPSLGFFKGCIDEVEVFTRALAQPEIETIFKAGAAGKCKPACTNAPVLICADDKIVPCGSPWNFDPPTNSAVCCTNLSLTLLSSNQVSQIPCQAEFEGVWQAVDCYGHTNTCTQTVTVVDFTPPILTCAPDKTVPYCVDLVAEGGNYTNAFDYSVVRSFSTNMVDGRQPRGALMEGSDGALYGATLDASDGASGSSGTIYKLNKDGSGYALLHKFAMAGTGGRAPYGRLMEGTDGWLYGTASGGGIAGAGAVFKLEKKGTNFSVIHGFSTNGVDGGVPITGLMEGSDGALYGATSRGGNANGGTVFKLSETGENYTVLHHFSSSNMVDGAEPRGALMEGSDGAIYGTAIGGGGGIVGTVFKLNKDGGGYTNLHLFTGGDGREPYAGLMEGRDGWLYGTTRLGGPNNRGIVFKLNKDGSGYTNLHGFSGNDGAHPYGRLVEGLDGALYGTTYEGGSNTFGVVYRLKKNGADYVVLKHFNNIAEGRHPYDGLMEGSDGAFYGTTEQAGANSAGTIFRLRSPCSWSFDQPTAMDACCTQVTVAVVGTVTGENPCGVTYTRTWRATDCCGNTTNCSQTVTVATPPLATASITYDGQMVKVTWIGPGHLEATDNLIPPVFWHYAGTTSPFYTSPIPGGLRFFRVVCP